MRCRDTLCALSVSIRTCFFFFNDTATTEIYTLSLHDALPISPVGGEVGDGEVALVADADHHGDARGAQRARHVFLIEGPERSEEHTSELQSPCNLVCRLLLEKKKSPSFPLQSALAT